MTPGEKDQFGRLLVVDLSSSEENQSALETIGGSWSDGTVTVSTPFRSQGKAVDGSGWDPAPSGIGAVWLIGEPSESIRSFAGSPLKRLCRDVLDRGGVIGASAEATTVIPDDGSRRNLSLLPDAVIRLAPSGDKTAPPKPDTPSEQVVYSLPPGSVLVARGRRLWSASDGKDGAPIIARLAATPTRPAYQQSLARGQAADLTALRKSARARADERLGNPPFPPPVPGPPQIGNGTLMIAGGGRLPKEFLESFVARAGGERAKIIVLPIAAPDPLPHKIGIAETFKSLGAGEVHVIRGRTPEAVNQPDVLAKFREATGIWFGGGRQWRFTDAYLGTRTHRLMHEVLEGGGVIGGSSAGATIQGEYLARGGPLGNREIMVEGYERSLAFLPGVAIDQHFTERNRQGDMSALVQRYPQLLGIGVDEGTALIVEGATGEVRGRGRVHFFDARSTPADGSPTVQSVGTGGRYHLVDRKALHLGTKPAAPGEAGDGR